MHPHEAPLLWEGAATTRERPQRCASTFLVVLLSLALAATGWAAPAVRSPSERLDVAQTWMAEHLWDEAAAELGELVRDLAPADPLRARSRYLLALCDEARLEFGAAERGFDAVASEAADPALRRDGAFRGARLRLLLGRDEAARQSLLRLRRESPLSDLPVLDLHLAWAEERTGRPFRAAARIGRVVRALHGVEGEGATSLRAQAALVVGRLYFARADRVDLGARMGRPLLSRLRRRGHWFQQGEAQLLTAVRGTDPFWASWALLDGGDAYARFADLLLAAAGVETQPALVRTELERWSSGLRTKAIHAWEACLARSSMAALRGPIREACERRLERPGVPGEAVPADEVSGDR